MATRNDREGEGRNTESRSASPATATPGAAGTGGSTSSQRTERGSGSTQRGGTSGGTSGADTSNRNSQGSDRTNQSGTGGQSSSGTERQSGASDQTSGGAGSQTSGQRGDSAARASRGTTTSDSERSIQRSDEGRSRSRGMNRGLMRSGSQGGIGRGMPFSPWELVRRMSEELGQLVTSMEPMRPGAARRSESAPALGGQVNALADLDESAIAWVPQIEVQQRGNELVVRADLPGVTPDLVEVSVDDGLLTISGERQQERQEEQDGFIRTERVYGAFSRTIPLPDGADEDNVAAAFRDGVLEIIVPVTASERGRRVPVSR